MGRAGMWHASLLPKPPWPQLSHTASAKCKGTRKAGLCTQEEAERVGI